MCAGAASLRLGVPEYSQLMRFLALAALLGLVVVGCGTTACSPCPPGTHASDPSTFCSVCVADTDAGVDGRNDDSGI
jgi:hypothetical protein